MTDDVVHRRLLDLLKAVIVQGGGIVRLSSAEFCVACTSGRRLVVERDADDGLVLRVETDGGPL
jgi:hypothetical protein